MNARAFCLAAVLAVSVFAATPARPQTSAANGLTDGVGLRRRGPPRRQSADARVAVGRQAVDAST